MKRRIHFLGIFLISAEVILAQGLLPMEPKPILTKVEPLRGLGTLVPGPPDIQLSGEESRGPSRMPPPDLKIVEREPLTLYEPPTIQTTSIPMTFLPDRNSWSLHVENDAFVLDGTDQYYTGGYHLERNWVISRQSPSVAKFIDKMPWMDRKGYLPTSVSLGLTQTSYTPEDIHAPPGPTDRPYAAFLRATATKSRLLSSDSMVQDWWMPEESSDSARVSFGVTGDYALGEEGQKWFHEYVLGDSREIIGWDTQIETVPVVQVEYDRLFKYRLIDDVMEILPRVGADLGNAFVNADAGVSARLGYNLPNDFGLSHVTAAQTVYVPGTPPPTPPSPPRPRHWSAYVFAEASATAVGWNLFLEGDNGIPDHDINIERFVGRMKFGGTVRYKDFEVSYQWVNQGEEFEEQNGSLKYGMITLGYLK